MDRAAAELFLSSLFVETTPERQETLRNAAAAAKNWEGLVQALEGHGVLALFQENVERAGIELPPTIAPAVVARTSTQRDDHHRSRLTLQRLLASASMAGIEVSAVGGSALCLDLYASPVRRAGELELFVSAHAFTAAVAAAGRAGLLLEESRLPVWWFQHTHEAITLAPSSSLLRGVRLRPCLHHPSMLLTVREPELCARRKRVPFEGHPLYMLDPLDALLEVCVTLAERAGELRLTSGRRNLLVAASEPHSALRLAQVLDVRTHIERRHAEMPVGDLVARAREWSCEPALRAALECIQMGLGFLPEAREWARKVAQALAAGTPPARNGSAPAALFSPDPIERLPRWLRPSDAYLARTRGLGAQTDAKALRRARVLHVLGVLGQAGFALAAWPPAALARRLARNPRRDAWEKAQSPERIDDVNEAWRAAARVEQQKPLTPRAISLPPQEEGAFRYPDHYHG